MRTRSRDPLAAAGIGVALIMLVVGALLAVQLATGAPAEVEIAGYSTMLTGRSANQRHNAGLAAGSLNGVSIAPGGDLSFNKTVRSWTADRGYVKAPVSYDGELIRAFGGGVCQTSTTFYNAALLAGLTILERHAHVFAPSYVSPGRDAAVAQYDIDLRVRNHYPWPIRIRTRVAGERLEVRLLGRMPVPETAEVTANVLSTTSPARLTLAVEEAAGGMSPAAVRSPGATGYRVVTYRTFWRDGRALRHELLSDDTYAAMNRIVMLRQAEAP
jgi:vancomycin resistance protein YoaR